MNKLSIYFLLILTSASTYSQLATNIASELERNSNSIVIDDQSILEVSSTENFSFTKTYKIKILNRYANKERKLAIYYNDFSSVKEAKVELLDALNRRIETYYLRDFDDISFETGVASDSRAKYLEVRHNKYPYYITVSYQVDHKGSLHYPIWEPQPYENMAVIKSGFTVINKSNSPIRHKSIKTAVRNNTNSNDEIITKWEVANLHSYEYENYALSHHYSPIVYLAPSNFDIGDFSGNMQTWENFGRWVNQLNSEKNNLSESQIAEIRNLTDSLNTNLEKVKAIYSYLQQTTRYASIQLGIGGWSPFDASFVHEKKYGDCKALSFYTKSALENVGVNSYYTLIRARSGAEPIFDDFPNAHFNHAILTVPLEKDTIWLECTSQTSPFGYMGTFTGNRKALLITEDGGKLINTKKYRHEDNIQVTKAEIKLEDDGSATGSISRKYQGLEIENDGFIHMLNQSESELKKWFLDELDFGSFEIDSFKVFEVSQEVIPTTGFNLDIRFNKAASSNSGRLFIKPSIFTDVDYIDPQKTKRVAPLEIRYPYQQIDSILFLISPHFFIESNVNNESFETDFGLYQKQIEPSESGFLFTRKFILKEGVYPAEKYPEFYQFIKDVQKSDKRKIVYSKKT